MLPGAEKCTKYKPIQFQQPITRGKSSTNATRKTNSKVNKVKPNNTAVKQIPSATTAISPIGDPSLAPVGLINQLTSLHEYSSSSLSSNFSDSDSNLVIDNVN